MRFTHKDLLKNTGGTAQLHTHRLQLILWIKLFVIFALLMSHSCTSPGPSPLTEPVSLSPDLEIIPLSNHTYIHRSLLATQSFGKVPCNGLIYHRNGEAFIADTPAHDTLSQLLINWLEDSQGLAVKGVIATHFHDDCLGGLTSFHEQNIPSYASELTRLLAEKDTLPLPQQTFEQVLSLTIGGQSVECNYLGPGHTEDNVVVWIPEDQVLFGGCLVKSVGAGKGNLADANVPAWPQTVTRVQKTYPTAIHVVPGHGKAGGKELLEFTIALFSEKELSSKSLWKLMLSHRVARRSSEDHGGE